MDSRRAQEGEGQECTYGFFGWGVPKHQVRLRDIAKIAKMKQSGGVLPFYNGTLYMLYQRETEKYSDFGGKKKEGETQTACAWRNAMAEGGFNREDVKEIFGEFSSKSYLCIIANLTKKPIAVKPNTSVRAVPSYHRIARDEEISGRLFIKDFEPTVKKIQRRYG